MNFLYKFLFALIFVLYVSRIANAQDDLNELDDDNDTTFDLDNDDLGDDDDTLDVSVFSTTGTLESTLLTETTDLTLDTEATESAELSSTLSATEGSDESDDSELATTDSDSDDDDDISATEGTDSDEDDDDASLDDSTAETDDLEDSDEEESDDGTEVLSETDSKANDDGDDTDSFEDIEEECAALESEQECRDDIADNGDRLCAYSDDDGCYAIVRRAGVKGDGSFDQGFEQALAAGQSESNALYAAIGIMAGVISALVAVIGFGAYRYYQKAGKTDHLTAVELMDQSNIIELDEAAVPIYTQGTR